MLLHNLASIHGVIDIGEAPVHYTVLTPDPSAKVLGRSDVLRTTLTLENSRRMFKGFPLLVVGRSLSRGLQEQRLHQQNRRRWGVAHVAYDS